VLLGSVVVAATVVGGAALQTAPSTPTPHAVVTLSADATTNRVTLVHRGGDALDVRRLSLRVSVDGTSLRHQPPVPFFAARGFRSGPTGPFNVASDPRWTAGESASFALARTNSPGLSPGSDVTVVLVSGGRVVARLHAVA